jgi:acetyltransferase-like isoleucine patch superfamily enzyme
MNLIFSKVYDKILLSFKKPIWLILNWLNFSISNVNFVSFPKISGLIMIKNRGEICLGNNININSYRFGNPVGSLDKMIFFCSSEAIIRIGNDVSMSRVLIFAQKSIIIEDHVMIGGGVQIWDTDFHPINFQDRLINDNTKIKSHPVLLKEGAFIGANSIILKGVTIGEYSVIAAGSIVTKNIPKNEIWGGNPACFIKKI